MDDLIKSEKKKIQDLDSDALAEEINSKFKTVAYNGDRIFAGAGWGRFFFILCSYQCWSICNFQKFILL